MRPEFSSEPSGEWSELEQVKQTEAMGILDN